jgi:hypothetical protein
MDDMNTAAMQAGVRQSWAVIAVITGAWYDNDNAKADPIDNAYFKRGYCCEELRWARKADVPIIPVHRVEDKKRIGEFCNLAPDDLKDISNTDFVQIDRSSKDWMQFSVGLVLKRFHGLPGVPQAPQVKDPPEGDETSNEYDLHVSVQGTPVYVKNEEGEKVATTLDKGRFKCSRAIADAEGVMKSRWRKDGWGVRVCMNSQEQQAPPAGCEKFGSSMVILGLGAKEYDAATDSWSEITFTAPLPPLVIVCTKYVGWGGGGERRDQRGHQPLSMTSPPSPNLALRVRYGAQALADKLAKDGNNMNTQKLVYYKTQSIAEAWVRGRLAPIW